MESAIKICAVTEKWLRSSCGRCMPERKEAEGRLGLWSVSNQVGASRGILLKLRHSEHLSLAEIGVFENRAIANAVAALLDAEGPREADLAASGFVNVRPGEAVYQRPFERNVFTFYRKPHGVRMTYETPGAKSWRNVAVIGRGEVLDRGLEADLASRYDAAALLAADMRCAALEAKRAAVRNRC